MYSARLLWPLAALTATLVVFACGWAGAKPVFRKPPPEGVVELVHVGGINGTLVELQDGSLMLIEGDGRYRLSTDEGLTWGEPRPLNCPGLGTARDHSLIRLQSGALALAFRGEDEPWMGKFYLFLSEDEGQSWGPGRLIGGTRTPNVPYYDTLIQLSSGLLVFPTLTGHWNTSHSDLSDVVSPDTWGTWRGMPVQVEGHGHMPEFECTFVLYSDDGGNSWQQGSELFGWFDQQGIPNGYGGISSFDEPSAAETADGRLLLFGRSQVGSIVYSYSEDGGKTWTAVRPTDLAASYSPPRLRRIPQTGDLLCVWNQVSREEIRRGYRRGRLSVALSQDSGATWGHFKTLELSEGLDDIAHIPPEYPIRHVRGRDNVGQLPDNWAFFHYANVRFAGEKVYIMYSRGWIEEKDGEAKKPQESVLRIYPLEWFYENP